MSIPLRLLLDPAYALPVREKPKMGAHLDLDDVVAGHPKAAEELATLLAENERLREALLDMRSDLRELAEREGGLMRHFYARICAALGREK